MELTVLSAVLLCAVLAISGRAVTATGPILEHPVDSFTTPGSTVVLRCIVSRQPGQPSYTVYWYRHSPSNAYLTKGSQVFHQMRTGTMWERLSVIGDSSSGEFFLEIREVELADAGEYSCVYFQGDRYLGESQKAAVTVYEAPDEGFPRCSMVPSEESAQLGQKVVLTCVSSGGTPKPRLDWMSWHEILPGKVEQDPRPKATYEFVLMETDNGAVFTCVENTPATPQIRTCSLKPFHRPTNVSIMASPVNIGQDAEFRCSAVGIPVITNYTWTVAGMPPEEIASASGEKIVVQNNNQVLKIVNVLAEDNGTIVRCYANNEINEEGVANAEVLVSQLLPNHSSGKKIAPRDNNDESGLNPGIIVGSVLILVILVVIIIILVRKLICLNKRKASSKEHDAETQDAESQPLKGDKTTPETPEAVINIHENPRPVTICQTPRDAIVEHIRETEEAGGEPIRPANDGSRVTVVGRLSCAGMTVDIGDFAQMYSKPVKKTETPKQADVIPDPEPDSKPTPKPKPSAKPALRPKPKLLPKPPISKPKPQASLVEPKESTYSELELEDAKLGEDETGEVIYENTYRKPDITMNLGEEKVTLRPKPQKNKSELL